MHTSNAHYMYVPVIKLLKTGSASEAVFYNYYMKRSQNLLGHGSLSYCIVIVKVTCPLYCFPTRVKNCS